MSVSTTLTISNTTATTSRMLALVEELVAWTVSTCGPSWSGPEDVYPAKAAARLIRAVRVAARESWGAPPIQDHSTACQWSLFRANVVARVGCRRRVAWAPKPEYG